MEQPRSYALAVQDLWADAQRACVVLDGIGSTGFNDSKRNRATLKRLAREMQEACDMVRTQLDKEAARVRASA